MATGDSWESRLVAGLAAYLSANGIGTWRPDGSAYAAGETPIIDGEMPPDPDTVIALTDYPTPSDDQRTQDFTVGIQIRLRGTSDRRIVRDLGAAIFDLLDSATRPAIGDIDVVTIWRQSYASMGQDSRNRWEASHNYYVRAMRPTTHRTD